MTREEAIEILKTDSCMDCGVGAQSPCTCEFDGHCDIKDAMEMAIKALEQKPILDKIRAEILEERDCAYADFEQYKVEYLGQDWEDTLDSLPQDDFRYGMERAIEIIDKYKAESEDE